MSEPFKEEREEVWRGVRVVIALATLELVNELSKAFGFFDESALAHRFEPEHVRIAFHFIVILVVAAVLVLVEWFLRRNAAKKARDKTELKEFERAWAQNCSLPERPYSLGIISYSFRRGRWQYSGIGFNEKFEPAAEWETYSLYYDELRREWVFHGSAWLRTFDPRMNHSPRGPEGSVTPILHLPDLSADMRVEGAVADFALGQSHGPFGIRLSQVPDRYKALVPNASAVLGLAPNQVEEILRASKVFIKLVEEIPKDSGVHTA
jgi:hypothetical protein